jgi:hypothetical protein
MALENVSRVQDTVQGKVICTYLIQFLWGSAFPMGPHVSTTHTHTHRITLTCTLLLHDSWWWNIRGL